MIPRPILVLGYGNPSRGDDALAPRLLDELEKLQATGAPYDQIEVIEDFQLQIEHTLDMQQRRLVLFIDASMQAQPPFEFSRLSAERDDSHSSHALTPQAVLAVYCQVNEDEPPPAFLLAIPGYHFELGEPLSAQAEINLTQAMEFSSKLLRSNQLKEWEAFLPKSK